MRLGFHWAAVGDLALTLALFASPASRGATPEPAPELAWPPITRECRPWSYWWWMGSAVDPTNLVRELQRYADAGWGGVHIIPIYGAKGWENQPFPTSLRSGWRCSA